MLSLIDVKNNSEYIDKSRVVYNEAFLPEERWNFDLTIENRENFNYTFYSIVDDENNNFVGIVMIWTFDEFYYIEYIAIDKNLRGNNYGSKAISNVLDMLNDKFTVLEVEPYDLNEIAKKRIEWYKRFDFILSDYEYNMPSIDKENKASTIKMQIMTNKEIKSKDEFDNITKILIDNVYKPRLDNIAKWSKID